MRNLFFKAAFLSFTLLTVGSLSSTVDAGQQQVKVRPKSLASGAWKRSLTTPPGAVGVPLLLTDGTVLCHSPLTNQWFKLTPTAAGNYQDGTWTTVAPMQSDFGPLYYASSVLADGRVVIIGGEYNLDQGGVWTNQGAVYNPVTNKWSPLPPPPGWNQIGDAQCQVMPDGTFMLCHIFDTQMASLNPKTMQWTHMNATGKVDRFNEEGWVLMPDGSILTCDAIRAPHCERYIPSLNKWISAGDTPNILVDAPSQELGPMVLMPDGKVFSFGAIGHNAIYTPGANLMDPGTWTAAPDFPNVNGQLDIADGPAVLLPNGRILAYASPGVFNAPSHFYEWDGTALLEVANVPNSATNPSYVGNFLILPNGQVMFTDLSRDVEFYTPVGGPKDAWRPTITSVPTNLITGKTFMLKGTQLNGLSNGSAYGDDSTNNTNYPLVRVTNKKSGRVTFYRTHDHSTMGVATGTKIVSTNFDVPLTAEIGPSTLEVVTNGIASAPVNVTIVKDALKADSITVFEGTLAGGTLANIFTSDNAYYQVRSVNKGAGGQVASAVVSFTPGTGINTLNYSFESSVSAPCQVLYFAFNWTTNTYDVIGNSAQTTADKVTDFTIQNASKYVNAQGQTKLLIRAVNPNRSSQNAPTTFLKLDLVNLSAG